MADTSSHRHHHHHCHHKYEDDDDDHDEENDRAAQVGVEGSVTNNVPSEGKGGWPQIDPPPPVVSEVQGGTFELLSDISEC